MADAQGAAETAQQRILLIEDDPAMVSLVSLGLRYEGFAVRAAASGTEGLRAATEDEPDLVILDLMLPGLDGLEVCRRLRQRSDTPILILTARDDVHERVAGLEAGADDYLVKPFDFSELAARVRARLRRTDDAAERTLRFADLTLDIGLHEAERGGRRIELTMTEYRLLHFFMRHPRQILSKELLLETVWGYEFEGDANIVEQYVRSLRRKLGGPVLIRTHRLAGYVLREADG